MQVLNNPTPPENLDEILYEVMCHTCNADIVFSKSEATGIETNQTATILYVVCPVCSTPVDKVINNKVFDRPVELSEYNHIPF